MVVRTALRAVRRTARRALNIPWRISCRIGPRPGPLPDGARVGVVLLSYGRPRNIDPILRSVLRGQLVERVILSNNNPELCSDDFVSLSDPRLQVIDQPVRTGPGVRFALAHQFLADMDVVLSLDDDIFLSPRQIERLAQHVLDAPRVPHGVSGWLDRHYVERAKGDTEVEWVLRAYAVTPALVARYFELLERMPETREMAVGFAGEDIVISSTGDGPPRIHDLGRIAKCPSESDVSVAISSQPEFRASRRTVREAVAAARAATTWGAQGALLARGGGIEPPTS